MITRRSVLGGIGSVLLSSSYGYSWPVRGMGYLQNLVGPIPAQFNMLPQWYPLNHSNFAIAFNAAGTQVWGGGGATISSALSTAPDGTITAQHLTETSGGTTHALSPFNVGAGFPEVADAYACKWTCAVIAKQAERSRIVVSWKAFGDANSEVSIGFDLAGGNTNYSNVVGANATLSNLSMTALPNGNYLCKFDFVVSSVANAVWVPEIYLDNGAGVAARSISYAGNGSSGVYLWWFNIMPAATWAMRQVRRDDFYSLDTIDLGNTLQPGYNWYINNAWPDNQYQFVNMTQGPSDPSFFSISSPSILKIYNPNNNQNNYTSMMVSANGLSGNTFVGTVWGGPVMFDGYMSWDGTNITTLAEGGAYWSWAVEFLTNNGLNATGEYLEIDFMEAGDHTAGTWATHNLQTLPLSGGQVEHFNGRFNGARPLVIMTPGVFTQLSTLWLPTSVTSTAYGIFLGFMNGLFVRSTPTSSYTTGVPAGTTYTEIENQRLAVNVASANNTTPNPGGGLALYVDWISIYQ